jgi:hypothetical protein
MRFGSIAARRASSEASGIPLTKLGAMTRVQEAREHATIRPGARPKDRHTRRTPPAMANRTSARGRQRNGPIQRRGEFGRTRTRRRTRVRRAVRRTPKSPAREWGVPLPRTEVQLTHQPSNQPATHQPNRVTSPARTQHQPCPPWTKSIYFASSTINRYDVRSQIWSPLYTTPPSAINFSRFACSNACKRFIAPLRFSAHSSAIRTMPRSSTT